MDAKKTLLKNSAANLVRGASAGLVAIVVPAVLVRVLSSNAFSAWALILQIASYVAMLDFGLQVGIGRFVARETARHQIEKREQFFFGGLAMLVGCALIALLATGLAANFLPVLFPKIAPGLMAQSRVSVWLVGASGAISLPGAAIGAVFIGLERFEVPAIVVGSGRVIQVASVAIVAFATHSLVPIAAAYAVGNLIIQVGFVICLQKMGPWQKFEIRKLRRDAVVELFNYCTHLSVWTLAMLLVSGLDVVIVGKCDFPAVAAYSSCGYLITLFAGFVGSGLNVLISRTSALEGKGDFKGIGSLLLVSTQLGTALFVGLGLIGAVAAKPFLHLWIGPQLGSQAYPILLVLIGANTLRLLMAPYATILMGTGEQRWATRTALGEGLTNLVASIFLGVKMGAIGVAWGTLVGSAVGVTLAVGVTFQRTSRIDCPLGEFLGRGIFRPSASLLPLALSVALVLVFPGLLSFALLWVGGLMSAFLSVKSAPAFVRNRLARLGPKPVR